jgi:hypothetical protein
MRPMTLPAACAATASPMVSAAPAAKVGEVSAPQKICRSNSIGLRCGPVCLRRYAAGVASGVALGTSVE